MSECLLCKRVCKDKLCDRHSLLYIYDEENNWFRKKKRLDKGVRRQENARKYHNTETRLYEILKLIFGKDKVITAVHPIWALSDKKVLLEYDFGIVKNNILVEYNGRQHFEWPNMFHKTKREFIEQKRRDLLKQKAAYLNGYKLFVIKYTEEITFKNMYKMFREYTP